VVNRVAVATTAASIPTAATSASVSASATTYSTIPTAADTAAAVTTTPPSISATASKHPAALSNMAGAARSCHLRRDASGPGAPVPAHVGG
jgi:hypothetical protein